MFDEHARLTLDLGIGLGIFFAAMLFVSTFIPSLFVDIRSEIDIANQAYRVSSLLVEDSGIYSKGNKSARNWEDYNATELCSEDVKFRPGLAEFDFGVKWGVIDFKKVNRLLEVLNTCKEKVRDSLGLNLTRFGAEKYHFHVYITNLSSGESLSAGDDVPLMAKMVKFRRIVYGNGSEHEIDVVVWR